MYWSVLTILMFSAQFCISPMNSIEDLDIPTMVDTTIQIRSQKSMTVLYPWKVTGSSTNCPSVENWNIIHSTIHQLKWAAAKGWISNKSRNRFIRATNGNRGGG